MRYPQIVIFGFDDWLGKQLVPFADEHRWLVKETRQTGATLTLLREPRPTVLFVQFDPHAANLADALQFLIDVHTKHPAVATVVVSDVKLNEEDRANWTATALDLGARYVLFPPLTRPVLEDLAGGLMTAILERAGREAPAIAPRPAEPVIDLAEEGQTE
jgi:hypothetical protein